MYQDAMQKSHVLPITSCQTSQPNNQAWRGLKPVNDDWLCFLLYIGLATLAKLLLKQLKLQTQKASWLTDYIFTGKLLLSLHQSQIHTQKHMNQFLLAPYCTATMWANVRV